jgi:hypothetical protein
LPQGNTWGRGVRWSEVLCGYDKFVAHSEEVGGGGHYSKVSKARPSTRRALRQR